MVLFQCFSVAFVSFACLLFPAESQLPNFVFSIKEVFYHDSTILVCSLLRIYEITNDVLYYDCFSPLGQKYRLEVLYDERYCGLFLEFS
jgi:hypothetical protein